MDGGNTLPKRKRGRQTTYTEELGEIIVEKIANGKSLREVCREPDMPQLTTVMRWIVRADNGFGEQYTRARMAQAIRWADEITEIADQTDGDWIWDETRQRMVPNHDHIGRARIRVDTRKWLLSKVLPKVYGDKVGLEITGKDGGPLEMAALPFDASQLSAEDRAQLRELLLRARSGGQAKLDAPREAQQVVATVEAMAKPLTKE